LKVLHTSDWHAGRSFKRVDRMPELAQVLEHLGDLIERERVDVLLVSGDVFDSGAPPPEAERLVFGFFKRVGRSGTHSVVVAGNHDSPARFEAWGSLAELVNVHAVPRPAPHDRGGLIAIETRTGETALVAAVPFAPVRFLVAALELAQDETAARQRYADGLGAMVANVTGPFRADTVNLLVLHTHLDGAAFSGSERSVHLGEEWAATPQSLPASAHSVALGHIHKPQRVEAAPSPAFYAGSALQLDFGEAGEEKSCVLVDARPRQPVRWDRVPYQGGTPLARVTATLPELERGAERLRAAGHLAVTVPLAEPDPDLAGKVRRLLPNALKVDVELPERPADADPLRPPSDADPATLFEAYCRRERGAPPDAGLLQAFRRLHAEAEEA
jgi:exonuclease SbcD